MIGAWVCERVREFESDVEKKKKKKTKKKEERISIVLSCNSSSISLAKAFKLTLPLKATREVPNTTV